MKQDVLSSLKRGRAMRIFDRGSILRPLFAGLILWPLFSAGCAVNPATGERQLALISEEQEIELGRDSDPKIVASMGLYADEDLQDYVQNLGRTLAAATERPHLPWTFRVLDDPVVNAFALPGGFVYITRGILPYLDSEAELAGVLEHEIGHVTARHSVEKMSRAQFTQIGSRLGGLLGSRVESLMGIVTAPVQLLDLKFSRDDETEADRLGVRYMGAQGYDPYELAEVMGMLGRSSGSGEEGRVPQWLSTHPTPENREENIRELASQATVTVDPPIIGAEDFIPRLEGLVFGVNPREGYFQENRFYHPAMAFEIALPNGWETRNLKQAVQAVGPGEEVMVVLTLAGAASPSEALSAFASKEGVQASGTSRDPINGIPAASADFVIEADGSRILGQVAFLSHEGALFQLVGLGTPTGWDQNRSAVGQAVRSFRRITDRAILNAQPARIRLVSSEMDMPLEGILMREDAMSDIEAVRLLNRLEGNPVVLGGTVLKIPSGLRKPGGE
jgi:predicted Zn-dependent protease